MGWKRSRACLVREGRNQTCCASIALRKRGFRRETIQAPGVGRGRRESPMNSVHLVGYIANDLELRRVGADDKAVLNFRVGVDRAGEYNAEDKTSGSGFFNVSCWNGQAEAVAANCQKGSKVAIEGQLRDRQWTDSDGNKRYSVEVANARVSFFLPKKSNGAPKPEELPPPSEPTDDGIPF